MEINDLVIIIMAGGLGKRMESDIPKVLHLVAGLPMIVCVLNQAIKLNPRKILIVVGKYRLSIEQTVMAHISDLSRIEFVDQTEALGTGHAILCCKSILETNYLSSTVLILSGDVPLLQAETMTDMITNISKIKIMVTTLNNPYGYGRIIEKNDQFDKITEEKDCTPEEKTIKKINCGIYAFDSKILCKYLSSIRNNNASTEYYLTDIIEIIKQNENIPISMYEIPNHKQIEIHGVNTKKQLEELTGQLPH